MVQKERLLFKILLCISVVLVANCNKKVKVEGNLPSTLTVSIIAIPKDTILISDKNLKLDNGIYYLNSKKYSGYIQENYSPSQVKFIFSFLNGQQQGISLAYFLDGKLKESRSYKDGKAFGRHYGYWQNGKPKFDFVYVNDKREGLQKQWWETGGKYSFLIFKNDREDGMQKAWRENGKPYINYQVKEGHRYGLQKSNLCYTLRDGKLKPKTYEN